MSVTVSAEDNPAGCGQSHTRPVDAEGYPVHPWPLACPPCEAWLRQHDSRWVASPHEIPETYDEQRQREALAVNSNRDREQIMALAMARLAGIDVAELPASVTRGALGPAPVGALTACAACGTATAPSARFCGSCGAPMRAVPAPAAQAAG
jgi:hypothetical protein